MGLITDAIVSEVRERTDIVQVIGEYVRLIPSGKTYKALCPFHQEKTPSFYVVPDKQIFHCFGCGKGGSVFKFLMEVEKFSFPESVKFLAGRAGIRIPEEIDPDGDRKAHLFKALEEAAIFFQTQLKETKTGLSARNYLKSRNIDLEIVQQFGIGYAPDSWNALSGRCTRNRKSAEAFESLGLIKARSEGDSYFDIFRNRIMIPIRDLHGRIAAFGGRTIAGSDGPKYLNSPESLIFNKGRLLFNFKDALPAIRRLDSVIVVEGYLDVISLVRHGFKNVVASLGTSITADQISILARNCKTVYFSYDADTAGQKAMLRAITLQKDTPLDARIISFPDAKDDPDSFVRREGSAAFQSLLDNSKDIYSFLIESKTKGLSLPLEIHVKEKLVKDFSGIIPAIQSPIARSEVTKRISKLLDIDSRVLEKQLFSQNPKIYEIKSKTPSPEKSQGAMIRGQEWVLKHLMEHPDELPRVRSLLTPDDFTDLRLRQVFEALCRLHEASDKSLTPAQILADLESSEIVSRVSELLVTLSEAPEQPFMQCVKRLVLDRMMIQTRNLQSRVSDAENRGDKSEVVRLTMEQRELRLKMDLLKSNS